MAKNNMTVTIKAKDEITDILNKSNEIFSKVADLQTDIRELLRENVSYIEKILDKEVFEIKQ